MVTKLFIQRANFYNYIQILNTGMMNLIRIMKKKEPYFLYGNSQQIKPEI